MQIPDYDNCVKWFACIKKRKLYAVWLSLPILMFFIIGVQWKIISKKNNKIKELLKTLSVKAKVLYGMGNLTENITISYDKSLTQEEAMEIVQPFTLLFSTVIKLYPSETESKDYSMLFFHINLAGKPLFMENGKVFYKND